MSLSDIPRVLREAVIDRDDGRCRYCSLRQYGQGAVFHVDHILPRSKGGATVLHNLALQCPYCSLHNGSKIVTADPLTSELTLLFHPLSNEWEEHFMMLSNGECDGLTAIGRATGNALRMNDPIPKTARAIQISLGLIRVEDQ